jgi:hypothetical protein
MVGGSYPKSHKNTRGMGLRKRQITHDGRVIMRSHGEVNAQRDDRGSIRKVIWTHRGVSQCGKRIIRCWSAGLQRTDDPNLSNEKWTVAHESMSNDSVIDDGDQRDNQYKKPDRSKIYFVGLELPKQQQ